MSTYATESLLTTVKGIGEAKGGGATGAMTRGTRGMVDGGDAGRKGGGIGEAPPPQCLSLQAVSMQTIADLSGLRAGKTIDSCRCTS